MQQTEELNLLKVMRNTETLHSLFIDIYKDDIFKGENKGDLKRKKYIIV